LCAPDFEVSAASSSTTMAMPQSLARCDRVLALRLRWRWRAGMAAGLRCWSRAVMKKPCGPKLCNS